MTFLILVMEPLVAGWPLPYKTLLLTGIMVPTVSLWLMPFVQKRLARVLGVSGL